MTKKARRVRRKGVQPRLSQAQLHKPTQPVVQEIAPLETATPTPAAANFGQEYRYVVKDLQRIGLLAAAMLGGLVILSFIL